MENQRISQRYAFGPFRFDATSGELHKAGRSVKLRPQASLVLHLLLARRGELVTRDELRQALWPDDRVVLFEGSIAAVVRELRRALGDKAKAPRFIETVPKRGYRLVPQATRPDTGAARTAAAPRGYRATLRKFCTSRSWTCAESQGQNAPLLPPYQSLTRVAWRGSPAPHASSAHVRRASVGGFLSISVGLTMVMVVLLAGDTQRMQLRSSQAPEAAPVTVAVLPFENLARSPAHTVLAKTVPRDLVGWLGPAAPGTLRVVDRTHAGTPGRGASGDDRRPDFVVHGSMREDRDAVVISARLLTGADGGYVWGEVYRRTPDDPSLTAREVAAMIAEGVLADALRQRGFASAGAAANEAATAAYRRGIEAHSLLSEEGITRAEEAYRKAIVLDPDFAEGYARLAEALISWTGPPVTAARAEQARQSARHAIELDPWNAVAHRTLGEIGLYFDRDWDSAERHLRRSVELSPAGAAGHHSHAQWLSSRGRHGEAVRAIDLARALEPGSVGISIDAMLIQFYARNFEETVNAARRLQQLWPGNEASHRYIVLSHLAAGDIAAAASEARTRLARPARTSASRPAAPADDHAEVLEVYWSASLRAVERHVRENSGDPAALALMNVQLDRFEAAVGQLEAAAEAPRFSYLLPFLGVSPAFDKLCGHPRFERTLRNLDQAALDSEGSLPRCAAAMRLAAAGKE